MSDHSSNFSAWLTFGGKNVVYWLDITPVGALWESADGQHRWIVWRTDRDHLSYTQRAALNLGLTADFDEWSVGDATQW